MKITKNQRKFFTLLLALLALSATAGRIGFLYGKSVMSEYFQLQVLSELNHNIFILENSESKNYKVIEEIALLRLSSGGNYFDTSIEQDELKITPQNLCKTIFRINKNTLFSLPTESHRAPQDTFRKLKTYCSKKDAAE